MPLASFVYTKSDPIDCCCCTIFCCLLRHLLRRRPDSTGDNHTAPLQVCFCDFFFAFLFLKLENLSCLLWNYWFHSEIKVWNHFFHYSWTQLDWKVSIKSICYVFLFMKSDFIMCFWHKIRLLYAVENMMNSHLCVFVYKINLLCVFVYEIWFHNVFLT